MYRVGLACLLSAAVVLGALNCSSSDLGPEPAQEASNLRTAAQEATAASCANCLDIHLGDYNLFLLEDYSGGHGIAGKVAAGGTITLDNFGVGSALPADNLSNALVAGVDLNVTNGNVFGTAFYGGSYPFTWSVNFHQGQPVHGLPSGFDFAARFAELRSLSARLATLRPNGTTEPKWGNLYLTGTDPCLNVFDANASDFNSALGRTLSVPDGSFVVVNIHGTGPTLGGGFNQPINPQRVLYNFVDATSLDARGVGLLGTALAPYARVTFNDGSWTGGIYAVSMSGNATGYLSPLDDMAGPQAEVCNGVDNNCNGQVDEGFECTGSSTRSCTAWCGATGTQACNPSTCGYGECTSASCCHADADCQDGFYCEGSTCAAKKGNGDSCGSSTQCASAQCVDGVCCNTACAGECDACNLPGHVGTCSLVPSTVQCRASGGACDVAEYCTGSSATCPADAKLPATTQCRASGGECDVAEYCTGSNVSCPANGFQASGAACSSDGNACTSDVCDGTGSCTHPLLPAGTSCGSGQVCDATGQCLSGCWIEGAYYAGGTTNPSGACQVCDPSQSISNWSFKPATTECRASGGVCDVAEYCTGNTATCPADTKLPATTQCRSSAGVCDVAEYCSGTSNDCPADGFASNATQCRASGGECDVAEFCTGSGATCPADGFQASGAACSSDGNACTSDVCDGTGTCGHPLLPAGSSCGSGLICTTTGQCVNECWIGGTLYAAGTTNPNGACQMCDPSRSTSDWSFKPATTQCRASAGVCDAAEYCTGSSATCPEDTKLPATTQCRASADACDVAEFCTGSSNDCPADGFASSTTQCRAADGVCDVAEYCTGSGANCPADGFQTSGADCASDGNACTSDVCDGAGGCSHPLLPAGTLCGSWQVCNPTGQCVTANECWIGGIQYAAGATNPNGACQVCDPSQSTNNWSFKPATTQCRASSGVCDAAEYCTGSSATCPADTKLPATTQCRSSAGACDVAEYCTGTGNDCPADGFASSTSQCRAPGGECDVAEYCTGTSASCPANGFQASGATCSSDGNACTSDVCDGTGTCSHPLLPAGSSCGSGLICTATGQCVSQCWIGGIQYAAGATNPNGACQVCDPSQSTNNWSFKPATTQCRASAGVCDVAEYCTGSSATCPADAKQPATTVCRASAGECDVAEYCTGSSNDCPADGFASSTTQCRASAGECDVAETCTGTGASCPADGFRASGAACSSDNNACTGDVCNGSGTCTHPLAPVGTTCASPSFGGWGSCGGFSDTCDEAGSQSRAVTTYACTSSGTCAATNTSETQACSRSTTGTGCGSNTSNCSACSGFSGTCGQTGTQSCTVTNYTCSGGTCNASSSGTQTQACSRNTNGTYCDTTDSCGACSYSDYCATTGSQSCRTTDYACSGGSCGTQSGSSTYSQTCTRSVPSCGGTSYGTWSACSFSDACTKTGTQSRTVTSQSLNCATGQCVASTSTETQSCTRTIPSCGGTSYGAWSSCSFSDACTTTGTQSRTVTSQSLNCATGQCVASTSTETQSCTRTQPPLTCSAPSYGAWSACSFSDACTTTGTQSRTVTSYSPNYTSCQCVASTSTETQSCTRTIPTCGGTSYGAWSTCGGFSDACDTTGTQSRTVTNSTYNCSTGQCEVASSTETQECSRSISAAYQVCNGQCVNINSSRNNCGGCGITCSASSYCLGGGCEPSCGGLPCP